VRGLPLLPEDKGVGPGAARRPRRAHAVRLALVGEADDLAALLSSAADLAAVDQPAVQQRLRRLTEVIADRRRYAEVIALRIRTTR